MEAPQILVVDLGSQYTTVIGRSIRELGFRTAILSPKKARDWLTQNKAR
jgi:GMP synthase-like glutamine amidotransferase